MATSVPSGPARVNRPPGYRGQTKVDVEIDPGRVDGARAREDPWRMVRRKQIGDAALIAFALVAGAVLFSNQARQGDFAGWAAALGALGGLAACGALSVRRRWPVAVTLAILPVPALSSFAAPAGLIAFYNVAAHRRLTTVLGVGTLALTTLSIAFALQASDRPELRTSLWLSLLSIVAGSLEFSPSASQADIARAAGVIRANAHAALEDLREVIGVLRAVPGDERPERPMPTLADVPELIEESRAAGMTIRSALDAEQTPEIVGRNAYRIVQEGLTNARKHARDTAVHVSVSGRPGDGLEIEVRNPLAVGRRNGDIPGAGAGLIGLAERVELAGGRLEHGITPMSEYRLWEWLPWTA